MNKNLQAIFDFRQMWPEVEIEDWRSSGQFKFLAKVSFLAPLVTKQVRTFVTIVLGGYGGDIVDIDETEDLDVNQLHLRFRPDFQDFTFDTDYNTLVIEGSSQKMGGEYVVRIHPLRVNNAPNP